MKALIIVALTASFICFAINSGNAQPPEMIRVDSTTTLNGHPCYVFNVFAQGELQVSEYLSIENEYIRFIAYQEAEDSLYMLDYNNFYLVKASPQVGDT